MASSKFVFGAINSFFLIFKPSSKSIMHVCRASCYFLVSSSLCSSSINRLAFLFAGKNLLFVWALCVFNFQLMKKRQSKLLRNFVEASLHYSNLFGWGPILWFGTCYKWTNFFQRKSTRQIWLSYQRFLHFPITCTYRLISRTKSMTLNFHSKLKKRKFLNKNLSTK